MGGAYELDFGTKPDSFPKSPVFYIAILVNLLGVGLILGGVFSDRWVVFSEAQPLERSLLGTRRRMLASHFGPWKACRFDGSCGHPWDIIAGIGKLVGSVDLANYY